MATIEAAAKKLASALNRCAKKVEGLSSPALNAAAAASLSLGQNAGQSYPAEYVRQRVSIVLGELEHLTLIAGELQDEPTSGLGKLLAALRPQSMNHPAQHFKAVESRLQAYCAARGSNAEWRRPTDPKLRRVG